MVIVSPTEYTSTAPFCGVAEGAFDTHRHGILVTWYESTIRSVLSRRSDREATYTLLKDPSGRASTALASAVTSVIVKEAKRAVIRVDWARIMLCDAVMAVAPGGQILVCMVGWCIWAK